MVIRASVGILIVSLWCASDLHAQPLTPPGSWEMVEALPAGAPVLVDLSSGRKLRGTLAQSGAETLTLMLAPGEQQTVDRSAIDRIRSGVPRKDGVGNGIGYGALVGAGTIAGFFVWAYAQCDDTCDAPAVHEIVPGAMAMGAGIGALTGFLIDRAHQHRDVLFRRGASQAAGTGTSVKVGGFITRRAAAVQVALVR